MIFFIRPCFGLRNDFSQYCSVSSSPFLPMMVLERHSQLSARFNVGSSLKSGPCLDPQYSMAPIYKGDPNRNPNLENYPRPAPKLHTPVPSEAWRFRIPRQFCGFVLPAHCIVAAICEPTQETNRVQQQPSPYDLEHALPLRKHCFSTAIQRCLQIAKPLNRKP